MIRQTDLEPIRTAQLTSVQIAVDQLKEMLDELNQHAFSEYDVVRLSGERLLIKTNALTRACKHALPGKWIKVHSSQALIGHHV